MKQKSKISAILFYLLFIATITAQIDGSKYFKTDNNIAIAGYDVVAYFNQNKAVEGSDKYQAEYDGTIFQFSNKENKNLFVKTPEKFLPQYGGFCAFAVAAKNAKVPTDPTNFKLRDGKLYLFFNDMWDGKKFNTIIPWNAAEKNMLSKAEENWKNLK